MKKKSCCQWFRLVLMLNVKRLILNDKKRVHFQAHHILHSPASYNTVDAIPGAEILYRHCRMAHGGCSRLEKVGGNDLS